jgi:hypothetical protein
VVAVSLRSARGQFRLNRFGDVTFEAAGSSSVIDICPFLA